MFLILCVFININLPLLVVDCGFWEVVVVAVEVVATEVILAVAVD